MLAHTRRSNRSGRNSRSSVHVRSSNQTARRKSSASGRSKSNRGRGFFYTESKEKKVQTQVKEIEKTINREGKSVKMSDFDAARLLVIRDSLPADREFALTAKAVPGVHRSCPGQFYVARVLVPSYVEIRPWLQHLLDNDFVNCRPKQESELPALMERVFDGHPAVNRSARALLNFVICMLAEEKRHPEYAQSSALDVLQRHKADIKALAPVLTVDKKKKLLPLVYKLICSRPKKAGGTNMAATYELSSGEVTRTLTHLQWKQQFGGRFLIVTVISLVLTWTVAPVVGIWLLLFLNCLRFLSYHVAVPGQQPIAEPTDPTGKIKIKLFYPSPTNS
jgi:hypothetical protein